MLLLYEVNTLLTINRIAVIIDEGIVSHQVFSVKVINSKVTISIYYIFVDFISRNTKQFIKVIKRELDLSWNTNEAHQIAFIS